MNVIILAAGKGTRMRSDVPKALHPIGGIPLVHHPVRAVHRALPEANLCVVVGAEAEQVQSSLEREFGSRVTFATQSTQRGTGHAVQAAIGSPWGQKALRKGDAFLVLPGDTPLLPADLITAMARPTRAALRLLTCEIDDPTGYGRVIRAGRRARVVEERDATPKQRRIREAAFSIYRFDARFLARALPRLKANNAQGELYLTDLVALAPSVEILRWENSEDVLGVNTQAELARARAIDRAHRVRAWMDSGVSIHDPVTTWIDADCALEAGSELEPGVILRGRTRIGAAARIGAYSVIEGSVVESGARVKTGSVIEESIVREGAQVGPYAHLRPGSDVGSGAKVGNFVELKKTRIGAGTSVAHLSYLGDAEVGEKVNVGCGFVTCNFDGRVIAGSRKHRTVIEDGAFIGSDCQTVAPVRIGKRAYVATGSTITDDVAAGDLAIARQRQVAKRGYAERYLGADAEAAPNPPEAPGQGATQGAKR